MTSELLGKTVLVTRPREQAIELQSLLEERGATVLLQPSIEILPPENWAEIDAALLAIENGEFNWVVFSSSNGVRFTLRRREQLLGDAPQDVFLSETQEKAFDLTQRGFARNREKNEREASTFEKKILAQSPFLNEKEETTFDALRRAALLDAQRSVDVRREKFAQFFANGGASVAVVGPGTADALRDFGIPVDLIPLDQFNAEGLVATLRMVEPNLAGQRILSVRASRGRAVLKKELTKLGADVREVAAYRSADVETPNEDVERALFDGKIDYATVASPASARALAKMFGAAMAQTRWVALSAAIADALSEFDVATTAVAQEATLESLVATIVALESRNPFDGTLLRGDSSSKSTSNNFRDSRAAI